MNSFFQVFLWWLVMQVLGWISLPIAMRLFRWLPDRGYAFAKALGLLLSSYLLWVGASSGLLRNEIGGILLSILLVAGLSAWLYLKRPAGDPSFEAFLREKSRLIWTVEVLFAAGFVLWVLLRAFTPYKIMETGGEKFMEIAFLNAIIKSPQFPPNDPWLAGFAISYYYFGYVMMAMLTMLTGVPASVGFELYDALLFALVLIGVFGIVYNIVAYALGGGGDKKAEGRKGGASQPLAYGLLGSLLVAVMGNLEGLLEAIYAKGILAQSFWQWLNIPGLASAPVSGTWYPDSRSWWWWRASRVIQDLDLRGQPLGVSPINEFPFFSFLLGDNHPHVLGLPFVLLAIGMAFNLFIWQGSRGDNLREVERRRDWWNPAAYSLAGDWLLFLGCALNLGALAFLNTWDFPIYLGLTVLAYGLGSSLAKRRIDREIVWRCASLGIGLAVAGVLLYIFFYVGFSSQAGGILPYVFPPTRLVQYLVMFGGLIFVVASFLAAQLVLQGKEQSARAALFSLLRWWGGIVLACLGIIFLAMGIAALSDFWGGRLRGELQNPAVQTALGGMALPEAINAAVGYRLSNPWVFLLLSLLLGMSLAAIAWQLRPRPAPQNAPEQGEESSPPSVVPFVLLMIFLSLVLTFSVELFYLRDSFGVRMNTVFKFYYQGWVMLGCASAVALWWLSNRSEAAFGRVVRIAIQTAATLLILAGMVYPLMAGFSRVDGFRSQPDLDGASPVARANPDDWAAIQWLLANADGAPTILEAPGKSYNYEGRISAFSGFPALLGWAVHESQWRGNYDEQGKREPDIQTIYTTHDGRTAVDLLHKWDVEYVIVGTPEQRYIAQLCEAPERGCNPSGALRKFDLWLDPVFSQGGVTVYRVP